MRLNIFSLFIVILTLASAGCSHSDSDSMTTADSTMSLSSPAFSNGSSMPVLYAYNDGSYMTDFYKNYSPPLNWSTALSGTKSLVLIVWCNNDRSTNWVLYMPTSTATSLEENATGDPAKLPAGSMEGKNWTGTDGWAGPSPTSGTDPYTYIYTLYALDTLLSLPSSFTRTDAENAMGGHIIGSASYSGKFSKMTITSTAFSNGGFIPVKYTRSSGDYIGNANPDLAWTNAPTNTISYVLLFDDESNNAHFILYNLPAVNSSYPEGGDNARPNPPGSTFGTNYQGAIDYYGPDPTSGQLTTYTMRLLALNQTLNSTSLGHANRAQLLAAIEEKVLAEATLTGKFVKLVLSSTGLDEQTGYWDAAYRYMGVQSSINPQFSWNSSGIVQMTTAPMSMVFLGTQMVSGTPIEEPVKTWVMYIPQTDIYEIPENSSWWWSPNQLPGNWIQAKTDRSNEGNWQDRGYDGFANYSTSSGVSHSYRFGLYVLASTIGIATDQIKNATYASMIEAVNNATILNKAFVEGLYLNAAP